MSTLSVDSLQKTDGSLHSRVSYRSASSVSGGLGYRTIASGINWHTQYNNTTQILGPVLDANSPEVFAINIDQQYHHFGGADHGYLDIYLFQTGAPSVDWWSRSYMIHYNDYYNSDVNTLTIQWDPNGTQSLSCQVINAYNSNGNNMYQFWFKGTWRQTI